MRILITATPGLSATGSVSPLAMGGLDLRTRFAREDAGFDVVFADPDEDLSEQVIDILSRRSCSSRDAVMLYIAAQTLLSHDGDLYLCLDPEETNIGDALADVAASLRDAAPGWALIVLDLVDTRLEADPTRIQTLVRAAEAAIDFASGGIELVVSLRSEGTGQMDSSPFVDALISEIDAADRLQGLTMRGVFDRVQRRLHGEVEYLHHARARMTFELLPLPKGRRDASAIPPAYHGDTRSSVHPAMAFLSGADDALTLPESSKRRAIIPIPSPSAPSISMARLPEDLSPDSEDEWATVDPVLLLGRQFDAPPGASLPPPSASMYPPSSSSFPPPLRTPVAFSSTNTSPPPSVGPASGGPTSGIPMSGIPISVAPSSRLTRGVSQLARYTVEGELLASQGDFPGAIGLFRKALGLLGPSGEPNLRAEMYTRIGELRAQAGDLEDSISDYEKALALRPGYLPALEALIQLCMQVQDWRGVMSAEERLLASLDSATVRFERLLEFAARWETEAEKPGRARHLFERAREIQPNNPVLDEQIRRVSLKIIMKNQA